MPSWTNRGDLTTAAEAAAAHTVPAGGSTGQVLAKTSGTDYDAGWATPSGGGSAAQIDSYVWNGTGASTITAWTKPTGAKRILFQLQAGGGGGGSGRRGATSTNRSGGGGGAGGMYDEVWMNAADVPSTLYVFVQQNSLGGAAITVNDTDGLQAVTTADGVTVSDMASGSSTGATFYLGAISGKRGMGGTVTGGTAGVVGTGGLRTGAVGGTGNPGAGANSTATTMLICAAGGAGGGGASTTNTSFAGGRSRIGANLDSASVAGAAGVGTAAAGDGTPGSVAVGNGLSVLLTSGGAGGGGNGTGPGGRGGDGRAYGAGAGGGGSSLNGYNSGAGGTGGPGYVIISTYF
jgi:hypothetical protein